MSYIGNLAREVAEASHTLALADETFKNKVLMDMASALRKHEAGILQTNILEVETAQKNELSAAMLDRLTLNKDRLESMAAGIEQIASLPDPIGNSRDLGKPESGIVVSKLRVPLGVVCMIYEARPNVTADAGALCFKSGNGVILRCGKEALETSIAIARVLQNVLKAHALPPQLISVIPNPERALMLELMQQDKYLDVIIPRGGEGLINYVTENSKVPVIQHFKGVCHLYVDKEADLEMAISLLLNGKTQRTGVCNALEGLLVHQDIATEFLPKVKAKLEQHNVKSNVCKKAAKFFCESNVLQNNEFGREYLDLEIAIRVIDNLEHALSHIQEFGSHHTEVICTKNRSIASYFQRAVDASVVMVNASSRFSDGSQLGLGAEIGIATTKLHAYGPMGLEALTTEKFLVSGQGEIRR